MQISKIALSPCKNCENRKLHCHSSCKAYGEYKQKLETARDVKNKRAEENNFNYAVKTALRRGKR